MLRQGRRGQQAQRQVQQAVAGQSGDLPVSSSGTSSGSGSHADGPTGSASTAAAGPSAAATEGLAAQQSAGGPSVGGSAAAQQQDQEQEQLVQQLMQQCTIFTHWYGPKLPQRNPAMRSVPPAASAPACAPSHSSEVLLGTAGCGAQSAAPCPSPRWRLRPAQHLADPAGLPCRPAATPVQGGSRRAAAATNQCAATARAAVRAAAGRAPAGGCGLPGGGRSGWAPMQWLEWQAGGMPSEGGGVKPRAHPCRGPRHPCCPPDSVHAPRMAQRWEACPGLRREIEETIASRFAIRVSGSAGCAGPPLRAPDSRAGNAAAQPGRTWCTAAKCRTILLPSRVRLPSSRCLAPCSKP